MPFDGSGNFNRTDGVRTGSTLWQENASAGIAIEADLHDAEGNDFAGGIEACLNRNGENSPSTDISLATHKFIDCGDGTLLDEFATLKQTQNQTSIYGGTAAGSSNAYTINLSPTPTTYTAGMGVIWRANHNSTAAATLNVNSLGAKGLRFGNANNGVGRDFRSNHYYYSVYTGTYFYTVPLGGEYRDDTWTPTLSGSGAMTVSGTVNWASFQVVGQYCHFQLTITALTIGGTPSGTVTVSMPAISHTAHHANVGMIANIIDGDGSGTKQGIWRVDSGIKITFRGGTNWTAGASGQIQIDGKFPI